MSTLIASAFNMHDRALIIGGKRITVKAQTDDTMTIGGYLVSFGDSEHLDTQEQWFTKETYYGPHKGNGEMTVINHCIPIKASLKALTELVLPSMEVTEDDLGLYAEVILDLREKYQEWVANLAVKGAWCFSSGSSPHLARVKSSGEITRWPIIEGSLTPAPVEARLTNCVLPLKSYMEIIETMERQSNPVAATAASVAAIPAQAAATPAAKANVAKSDVIGVAIKSLPAFRVLAIKSEYFGDYLEQSMTSEAIRALTCALNYKLYDVLYANGDEPDPEDIAEFPAILAEFSEIYMATIVSLMGAKIAEESAEETAVIETGDEAEPVGGGLSVKSLLRTAFVLAIKANAVLSSKNESDLKTAIDNHMAGIDLIQGVLDRHTEKSDTATKSLPKRKSAELLRLRRENAALKAQQATQGVLPVAAVVSEQPASAAIKAISWNDFAAVFNTMGN